MIERVGEHINAGTIDGVGSSAHNAARCAIFAMREPTPEMLEAGIRRMAKMSGNSWNQMALEIWQAMIDAVLEE